MLIYVYKMKLVSDIMYPEERLSYNGISRTGFKTLKEAEDDVYDKLMIIDPRCDEKFTYWTLLTNEQGMVSPIASFYAETRGGDVNAEIYEVEL